MIWNSRNIAVRVDYWDDPEYRELGYENGVCYRQDPVQGWRLNTDAPVFLTVMATKEQVEAQKEHRKLRWDVAYLYGVISEEEYRRLRE